MKRQQRTVGAFLSIKLPNGKFAYARILEKASFAFYDLITDNLISDVDIIKDKPKLFIVSVYNDAVTKGRWERIDRLPLEDDLKILPMEFIQDPINPQQFRLYDPNTGTITPTERAKCKGLEVAAVWEAENVESRIVDYYEGRSNIWVEGLTLEKP